MYIYNIYIYIYICVCVYINISNCPAGQPRLRACSQKIEAKILPKPSKMWPKSVHEALVEGLGSILGGLWEGLGARLVPRGFQGPKSESFDPLLASILEAKIDQKSILRLS